MSAVLVFLGGAIGACARFWVASWLDAPERPAGPRFAGTLTANLVGSFLLGLFVGLGLTGAGYALLGSGFCGGLTTYSAFALQATRSGPRAGAAYVVVTVAGAVGLCALGYLVAQA